MRVCVWGGVFLMRRYLSFHNKNIFAEMLFFFVALFCTKKGKKKLLCPHLPETAKETRKEEKVKNVSQFERWSDDSHAIERTRDVENTRQENSKVNPFARCIERDRG
jgi:hypothetical protein